MGMGDQAEGMEGCGSLTCCPPAGNLGLRAPGVARRGRPALPSGMPTAALRSRGLFLALLIAVLGGPATSPPVAAQSTLIVEARAGISSPRGSFRNPTPGAALKAAPATGVQFGLRRGSRTYIYIGFSQLRFDCEGEGCGGNWVATQWDAGVRAELTSGSVVPWLRAGVVAPSVENVPGARRSARGWGGEGGAGLRFALTERLSLSPGARFGVVDVGRSAGEDVAMRYLLFDLGLVVAF